MKQISSSGNGLTSLDKIAVKLANNKKPATLNDVGTLNVIDTLRVEFTAFDPQVTKFTQF